MIKDAKPGKPRPRIISLDRDSAFLKSMETFNKNHRFRLANKTFYINGGVRKDSTAASAANAMALPELPRDQITDLL